MHLCSFEVTPACTPQTGASRIPSPSRRTAVPLPAVHPGTEQQPASPPQVSPPGLSTLYLENPMLNLTTTRTSELFYCSKFSNTSIKHALFNEIFKIAF